jgi:hypothetical protein
VSAKVPYGGGVGVDAPDVGVDELLVVGAVEGVVEGGFVGADFDAGGCRVPKLRTGVDLRLRRT